MNGAESLVRSLAAAGVDVCFANPGTTEMHLVRALDDARGIRPVLGLFEGVCTGAADGYARMAGRPAMTLLHLGPGMANGLANLHNAQRAPTPLVNVVGDHATWHRGHGAPLESDIEALARPMSAWVRTAAAAETLARDGAEAVEAARAGGVATLIVPADCAWTDVPEGAAPAYDGGAALAAGGGDVAGAAGPRPTAGAAGPAADGGIAGAAPVAASVEEVAGVLAGARDGPQAPVLLLGAGALSERGLRAAARVAAAAGVRMLTETFPARLERGGDLPDPPRLPYFPEQAAAALAGAGALVLAGARAPVAFFGYPGTPSRPTPPGTPVHVLATLEQDAAAALEQLADALGAPPAAPATGEPPAAPADGPLDPLAAAQAIAAGQPEGAIVIDEALTLSAAYVAASGRAARHTSLSLTGGAIGFGLPAATGAAIACPDRPVLALQADGSGMYTVQALWSQVRERLDVTTLVCANRSYRILVEELRRAGVERPAPGASSLTSLADPPLDWVALASGMGVPAVRATTAGELSRALATALAEPGPHLVEMVL